MFVSTKNLTKLSSVILKLLYCREMGIEVTDICMDKEPDCVIIYSNTVSHDPNGESAANQHDGSESYEHINEGPEIQSSGESTEAKEYEVKECTTENSVEVPELCRGERCEEEQRVVNSNFKAGVREEMVRLETQKKKDNDNSQIYVKQASRPVAGNGRTKHTVPQPFALATEKRASCGASPAGVQPDAGPRLHKSSNANNVRRPNTTKPKQVTTD